MTEYSHRNNTINLGYLPIWCELLPLKRNRSMAFLVWALTWIVGPASSYGLYFLEQRYLAALTLAAQLLALLVLWKNGESADSKFEKRAPSTCTLPNGLVISQWAQGETDFLYTEIFESVQSKSSSSGCENNSYISHGLTLEPGATVFDVGANIGMTTLFLAKNHLSGDVVDDPNLEAAESTEEDEEGEEEEDDDVPLGDAAALKQLTCVALKAACARRGISQSGRKADLVARLLAAAPEESDAAARSNAHARRTSSKGDDWVPLSRIFCFEPVPAIHRVLSRNAEMISTRYSGDSSLPAVEAAALTGHVDVVALNVGLSDAPGVTTFDWHPNMSLWSTGDAVFGESRLQRWRTDMPSSIAKKQGDGELPAWLACLPSAIKIWLGNKMLDAISLKVRCLSNVAVTFSLSLPLSLSCSDLSVFSVFSPLWTTLDTNDANVRSLSSTHTMLPYQRSLLRPSSRRSHRSSRRITSPSSTC